jgi:uncharacterized membrane protein YqjE
MKRNPISILCLIGILIVYYFDKGRYTNFTMFTIVTLALISLISAVLFYYKSYKEGTFNKTRFLIFVFALLITLGIYIKGLLF